MSSGQKTLTILLWTLATVNYAQISRFKEQLWMEEAEPGQLLTQLHFEASTPSSNPDVGFFPLALRRIAADYGVRDLQVSLARGRAPKPSPSQLQALPPAGLIFKVQFLEEVADTQAAYIGLAESLGGLLAVPLGRVLEDGVVAAPLVGWFGEARAVTRAQVYASVPWEGCCSNQLAAWANLLPCRLVAGLAALLDTLSVAEAPYLALQLRLSREGVDEGGCNCCEGAGSCGAAGGQRKAAQGRLKGGDGEPCCACCTAICMELSMAILSLPVVTAAVSGSQGGDPFAEGNRGGVEAAAARLLQRVLGRPLPSPCQPLESSAIFLQHSLLNNFENGEAGGPVLEGALNEGLRCVFPSSRPQSHLPGWLTCYLVSPSGSPSLDLSNSSAASPRPAWLLSAREENGAHAAANSSLLWVARHIVPHGLTAGELVLNILVSGGGNGAVGSSSSSSSVSSSRGSEGGGSIAGGGEQEGSSSGMEQRAAEAASLLHMFQLVPWQLPISLHTLRLRVDEQDFELSHPWVAWHSLLPAGAPSVPGVLELLLKLPAGRGPRRVMLAVGFRKRLLAVFQHPPDASRGVDIPAAEVTLVPGLCASLSPSPPSTMRQQGSAHQELPAAAAAACAVRRAYSSAHLVPLPIPDLSMPFNVCCFTGTVMAVYFGGVLNALLRPAAGGSSSSPPRPAWRAKLRRVLAVLLLGSLLALYLDKDLQRAADAYLHWLALGRGGSLPAREL